MCMQVKEVYEIETAQIKDLRCIQIDAHFHDVTHLRNCFLWGHVHTTCSQDC